MKKRQKDRHRNTEKLFKWTKSQLEKPQDPKSSCLNRRKYGYPQGQGSWGEHLRHPFNIRSFQDPLESGRPETKDLNREARSWHPVEGGRVVTYRFKNNQDFWYTH